jgi:hypothetical protein
MAEAWKEDPYAMASLRPATTGLPMTIWVSERAGAPQDVRVKVCTVHSSRMPPASTASVAVRPQPRVAEGQLSPADFTVLSRWIALSEAVLVDYWDDKIDTSELLPGCSACNRGSPADYDTTSAATVSRHVAGHVASNAHRAERFGIEPPAGGRTHRS